MEKTVYEDVVLTFVESCRKRGVVELQDIVNLIEMFRKYENDTHVCVSGQNGSGKSFLLLMLMKKLAGKDYLNNLLFADADTDTFCDFLVRHKNTCLGLDELNHLFSYKLHASQKQNRAITMIEMARSHRVAIIGCVRDPRKLTLNYRNGKLMLIIAILDRFIDGSGSYAAVLLGNNMSEGEDRFCLDQLDVSSYDIANMRAQYERLPSFIGYMRIPDARKELDASELKRYDMLKEKALIAVNEKGKEKGHKKRDDDD